jgi:hypothetical protein
VENKMKVEITKCYCISVLDKDGNELKVQYEFCDKETAKEIGRQMKEELLEGENQYE